MVRVSYPRITGGERAQKKKTNASISSHQRLPLTCASRLGRTAAAEEGPNVGPGLVCNGRVGGCGQNLSLRARELKRRGEAWSRTLPLSLTFLPSGSPGPLAVGESPAMVGAGGGSRGVGMETVVE